MFVHELLEQGIWRDKEGNETPISDMDTRHIMNSLRLIKSHPMLWRQSFIPLLEAELDKRGIKHG